MKKVIWITDSILAVALLLLVGFFFLQGGGYQTIGLKGYVLQVPRSWQAETASNSLLFHEKNVQKGSFCLLYEEAELGEVPKMAGFLDVEPSVRESDRYAVKVYELTFTANGQSIVQYVFCDLPSGPPYQAVLTLIESDEHEARRILASVEIPVLGELLPQKPIEKPDGNFLQEQATYSLMNQDGVLQAYYVHKLEKLVNAKQPLSVPMGLHILTCREGETERLIESWYYLALEEDTAYLYTYYAMENGRYVYDNDPKRVKKVTKEVNEQEGITRYLADGLLLLEVPYNQYSENKTSLLEQKHAALEDSALKSVVASALPHGAEAKSVSLKGDDKPYTLHLLYTLQAGSRYVKEGVLDESVFYQNALVLFSLIDDVDVISMEVQAGDETYYLSYERKKAEEQFENQDLRDFSKTEESFENFVDEIPKVTPPPVMDTQDGGKTTGTKIIFTDTVTIRSGQMITHPRTGVAVVADYVAEKYGVTQYLNRPITVTAYEQIVNGETRLWGTATCDGVVIASYPFASREEMNRLISVIS